MYSFAQRSDTKVIDEPFYAVYFLKTGLTHPGHDEVIRNQPNTEIEVLKTLFTVHGKDILFIKNMSHHLQVLENFPLHECVNVFLIRNPKQIIASYAQVIDKPVMRDIGIEYQYGIFKQMLDAGNSPIVLDSGILLDNPEAVLNKLCSALNIPFEKSMLQWAAGPKPYDGVWAPYWYANVHRSTSFEKQPTSERELPEELNDLYNEAKMYYEKLLPFALQ